MKSNKKKKRNRHDMHLAAQPDKSNVHMSNEYKNKKIPLSTANASVRQFGPFPTSTKQMAGYFTVSGIENEISQAESEWPCFALKELPDNASDWLNDYYPVATINRSGSSSVNHCKNGRRLIAIRIQIDQMPNDPDLTRIFRITVRNSNVDQIEVFGGGREGLEQIFDYTQWLSTKRNQHRMTAGSLGDYLKRHAGMGYASWNNIVRNNMNYTNSNSDDDNIQWEEPLIFRFNGTEYKVFVYYDIYKGLPESVIKYAGKSDAIDYTEVECALPVSRINCNGSNSNLPLFDKLYRYYNWYKIPKADIKFSLDMRYDIRHITEESITIQEALGTIREVKCLPKKYLIVSNEVNKITTVQDIAYNNRQIAELFTALRKGMQPESPNIPFRIKDRERQLIDQLSRYKKGRIDLENAHAKVVVGHFPSRLNANEKTKEVGINERSFYYWIEAAIAPLSDLTSNSDTGKLEFIGYINGTPPLDGGMSYFENGDYYWTNKASDFVRATGMRQLLEACGFSTHTHFSQRRKASILFLNLQTPCPEWQGSAGKTRINLEPYQKLIAETVSKLAYKIPSLHGKGIHTIWATGLGGIYKPFLVDFLKNRHKQILRNYSNAVKDRLTQSGAWYRERPKMIAAGFKPRNKVIDSKGREIYDWNAVRKGFTSSINKVIKELWPDGSVTRESLGIVAKARAMLYINGQVYPVSFDSKEELAGIKVTDMIIVEKEGITDVLLDTAQKYRIALVATAGHFTEYVTDLMKLASEVGRINVCVLTDYDIDGINMWRNANEKMRINIKRIGITQDVVKWLHENGHDDIQLEDIEEEYTPNPNLFGSEDDSYLQVKRIELDSIIQKVGPEVFWKYIVHRLEIEFPAPRDYREIVPEPAPEDYYPDKINEFLEYIAKYTKQVYAPKWEEIKESQLKEVKGLLQIDDKKDEIDESLRYIVQEEDKSIQKIIAKLEELRRSGELPELK